ncbi:hypothetical protein JX265_003801 [Neoarthrinium moseri]|uniref:Cation/H+ exchanger transmembrane domain-containing protein n=1 Tax=Neoarthrinium moseri TaxID=1658444 RepID=A0A9P9WSQ9_9PEZI|nr:hypothetical protein JX265_003801 [Neoarthrinium moseri]
MPTIDVSQLNIIATILGTFTIVYGLIAVKIKNTWYLVPAVVVGIVLGPISAKLLDAERWIDVGSPVKDDVTLGVMRVMIAIQLVIAGYQLPGRYLQLRAKEMAVCLFPVMTLMWLATAGCVLLMIPKLTFISALIVAACVTSTDPVLSQAVAKGPFADKYIARPLREIISAEAGANDGFASPFLMLGVSLTLQSSSDHGSALTSEDAGLALKYWLVEALLYIVLVAIIYGTFIGFCARKAVEYSLARRWIDTESYLLFPTALGLFIVGTCGVIGTSDLLACFAAGCVLNWDDQFLAETKRRHDEVNSCIDVLLNYGGFMYIGITIPWELFHQPDITGITLAKLIGLGFLVLILRRVPALLVCYRMMPAAVKNWKEAIFMGYFGPIGVGAIYYLEHTRHLFLAEDYLNSGEKDLLAALTPVVYFLALFSIAVHGVSIPALNAIFALYGVQPVTYDAEEIRRRSIYIPTPTNAVRADEDMFIAFNRFSRPNYGTKILAQFHQDSDLRRVGTLLDPPRHKVRRHATFELDHIGPKNETHI